MRLTIRKDGPLRLLLLGAHSDDIEIGCGGTILSLLRGGHDLRVHWVVFSAHGDRQAEARASAAGFLEGATERRVTIGDFRDGFMPFQGTAVKEFMEELKAGDPPDLVFTHRLEDRHQDHRLLADLTWNTFRNHLILEYEIPKYEGDLGHPNVFFPIDDATARRKIDLLMSMFGSQRSKRWFSKELFTSVMQLRGMEAGLTGGHAEAFYVRKLLLDPAA